MSQLIGSRIFFSAGFLVCLAFSLAPDLNLTVQTIGLVIAVSFIGVPHGAIDAYIAQNRGIWQSSPGFAVFIGIYILISAFIIFIWMLLPVFSLSAFLIISAWHFGNDGNPHSPLERWLFGGLLLSLPAYFHSIAVSDLFIALSGTTASLLTSLLYGAAPFFAIATLVIIFVRMVKNSKSWVDLPIVISLILFAWILPPLVYFAVYFCGLHSPAHFKRVVKILPRFNRSEAIFQMIAYTVLTLVFAITAYVFMAGRVPIEQSLLQILFVGLAALTVPHMILVDGICRKDKG